MLAYLSTPGFSIEAGWVAEAALEQNRNFQTTVSLGKESAFEELATVWEECKHPNWDGYQAQAVSQASFRNAYRLLESLPLGLPLPSIGGEPDGEITLEWHHSPRRTLSVSITADEYLHYSGLFGPNHTNGTVAFFGEVPSEILALIRRVHGS